MSITIIYSGDNVYAGDSGNDGGGDTSAAAGADGGDV